MAEWSKAHAWKVCVLQKGTKGSNPFLSAKSKYRIAKFHLNFSIKTEKRRLFFVLQSKKVVFLQK